MMRPEFVKRWRKSLSSDAFSSFQARTADAKQSNRDVKEATEHLRTATVVAVCEQLFKAHDESFSLRYVFHREGLNMRYLGLVYKMLVTDLYQKSKQNLYKLVQVEAFARVAKNMLRTHLRSASRGVSEDDASESRLLAATAQFLNSWFCRVGDPSAWKQAHPECVEQLVKTFNFSDRHANKVTDSFLRNDESLVEQLVTGERETVSRA